VTGLGAVAPNGVGKDMFAEALSEGRSGVSWVTAFDPSGVRVKIAGEVRRLDPLDYIPDQLLRKIDRFAQLGLVAAQLAVEDAKLSNPPNGYLTHAGLIVGSGQGGLLFHEQTILDFIRSNGKKKASAGAVQRITPNAVTAHIAIRYGIKGINQVISTACSSGGQAIGQAYRMIQMGLCERVVTGGVEAPISPVMLEMYHSMMVLAGPVNSDPTRASRPFDATREGFVLSEGAGILVLESLDAARERQAPIYAEVIGFGSNCGAYHMVTPDPTGEDASEVMDMALKDAGISPDAIDYIGAHGTSTKQNDLAETRAIKKVFGKRAWRIPISSIKSMIGHTIGAAGGLSAIASCLTIQRGIVPPTINLDHPDPECDLDYVPNTSRQQEIRTVLSNSFGFGSNNVSLIFRRV